MKNSLPKTQKVAVSRRRQAEENKKGGETKRIDTCIGHQHRATMMHTNLSLAAQAAAARGAHAEGLIHLEDGSMGYFGRLYFTAWLQSMCVYYGVAVFLHYAVPALTNPRRLQHGDIQSSSDTRRDAMRALVPVAIRAGMLATAERLHQKGYSVMSNEPLDIALGSPWGVAYVVAMIVALDVFHDTWFYFAHRLLHHRYLMKRVHYMHHQSNVPSAFSGYRFLFLSIVKLACF